MSEKTIRLKLYPQQHNFFKCPDRFAAFVGGIGSGKTFVGSLWGIQQASAPGTLGLVIAPTYPMLRDVAWRAFIEIGGEAIAEKKRGEMILTVRGGGEILFRSADNPDRLRGPNVHWALLDEAALCPRDTWDVTIGRLRAGGTAGPCRIVTTPKGYSGPWSAGLGIIQWGGVAMCWQNRLCWVLGPLGWTKWPRGWP